MLYLFNTASRPLYLSNVLNTLYLPTDAINTHRWQQSQVDEAIPDPCTALNTGTECTIVYAGLSDDAEPVYVPLRRGRLARPPKLIDGRFFFDVLEGDYLSAVDPAAYREALMQVLEGHRPPRRPHEESNYVIRGSEVDTSLLTVGPDAWRQTVDAIGALPAFRHGDEPIAFFRAEVIGADRSQVRNSVFDQHRGRLPIPTGIPAYIRLTYRFPGGVHTEEGGEVELHAEGARWITKRRMSLSGASDSKEVGFEADSLGVRSISLSLTKGQQLLVPDAEFEIRVVRPIGFYLQVLAWLVVFAVATYLSKATQGNAGWTAVAASAQTLVVVWAVRLFGQKPF